jgi:hypothetical protein
VARIQTIILIAFTIILSSTNSFAENTKPDRQTIDATLERLNEYWSIDDMQSWVGLFAEDATFLNSALTLPVVGQGTIRQLAKQWPKVENIREWQVVEGNRMAVGWRERGMRKDGKMSAWYRGMSTFVFNADGLIESYEGVFNLEAVKAAYSR